MYMTTHVNPDAKDVRAWTFDTSQGDRIRAVLLADDSGSVRVEVIVDDRLVLDALQAALNEIRADFDAQDARAQVPTSEADWPERVPA